MHIDLETIEPALCHARTLLLRSVASEDEEVHRALRAVRDFVELQRESSPEEYNLEDVLRPVFATQPDVSLERGNVREVRCRGDREQVAVAIRAILQSIWLDADAITRLDVVEEDEVPVVRLSFDGPGKLLPEWRLGGFVTMTREVLEPCWTLATRGGRFDRRPDGIDLRLAGIRVLPEIASPSDELLDTVRVAERNARVVSGDATSRPAAVRQRILDSVDKALAFVDDDGRGVEPADISVMLAEVVESQRTALDRAAIECASEVQDDIPPIAIHRKRLRSVFVNLLRHSCEAFTRGGEVSILAEYHSASRRVELLGEIAGTQYDRSAIRHFASIRRAVEAVHRGEVTLSSHESGLSVAMAIPDPVGQTLDAWIPGFERFTSRSQQMLRLLKSGGPTPPEEFLLGGILEEELERMLLSRLSVAPATNLAHDMAVQPTGFPGSSPERLEKALTQIRKGKPKKEICKPAYAAEILWAFRRDDRHRAAVGTLSLDDDALERLCTALFETPPDHLTCLRVLARTLE